MWKDRSNTLDRMWRENLVVNCGLGEMRNECKLLVAKREVKLLEYLRI